MRRARGLLLGAFAVALLGAGASAIRAAESSGAKPTNPAARAEAAQAGKPAISALAWLAGTWTMERNGRTVIERWADPAGGVMIGTGHTFAGERTIEYEFVIIRPDANGDLHYVAKPSGQPEAAFKLVRVTEREVLFENPEHDYPQRIPMCSRRMVRCSPRSTARRTGNRAGWSFCTGA